MWQSWMRAVRYSYHSCNSLRLGKRVSTDRGLHGKTSRFWLSNVVCSVRDSICNNHAASSLYIIQASIALVTHQTKNAPDPLAWSSPKTFLQWPRNQSDPGCSQGGPTWVPQLLLEWPGNFPKWPGKLAGWPNFSGPRISKSDPDCPRVAWEMEKWPVLAKNGPILGHFHGPNPWPFFGVGG